MNMDNQKMLEIVKLTQDCVILNMYDGSIVSLYDSMEMDQKYFRSKKMYIVEDNEGNLHKGKFGFSACKFTVDKYGQCKELGRSGWFFVQSDFTTIWASDINRVICSIKLKEENNNEKKGQ